MALVCFQAGFPRHVWVALRLSSKQVLRLDYRFGQWCPELAVNFAAFKKEKGDVFVWIYDWKPLKKSALLLLPTCVGIAKSLLGVRNPFILTAGQLKRWLIRHEGDAR